VAIERDLWVVSDEAYEHLLYDGAKHVSIASLPGMAERTLTAYTFSKSYAMTGWRVGYLVSPPALRGVAGPILSFYTTHGVFPAVQSAARAAVVGPQDAVETMRRAYEERRGLMLRGLEGQGAITVPAPKGAVLRVRRRVARARRARAVGAGRGMAVVGRRRAARHRVRRRLRGWVRMSLATRADQVEAAAKILRERYATAAPEPDEVLPGVRARVRRRDRRVPELPRRARHRTAATRGRASRDRPPRADAASGALLCGVLEGEGIRTVLRPRRCPATAPCAATGRRRTGARSWWRMATPRRHARSLRTISRRWSAAAPCGTRTSRARRRSNSLWSESRYSSSSSAPRTMRRIGGRRRRRLRPPR
jgi:hypothetical protein